MAVALQNRVVHLLAGIRRSPLEGCPVGVIRCQIRQHRVRKAVPDGLPGRRIRLVQGVAQVDVPHQPAGVFVHRIAAGGGGQHRQEVALLLRGDAPLVGQLVGDGGGDQAGGGVHVDVGLPGESKVDAGEVHGAHDPGEEHPLGRSVLKFQEGEQVLRALVDVRAPGKDLVQRRIERPRLIPGHLVGCLRQIFREPRGHRRQIRERYLLRPDAGPVQVVLMLGTNDCKTYNHASADRIGKGIEKLIQQIRKADSAIDILLVSPIELGEDVWKPGFDLEFDQHSVKVSKELKQTYLKIAWKYGCDFLAASDVAKPSKADMEHMNEKGHKNLAEAIESFLVEKERNHSNNYVNVV